MERVSDEQLEVMIAFAKDNVDELPGPMNHCRFLALTELRERREKTPCPEHAKMVAEWDKKA